MSAHHLLIVDDGVDIHELVTTLVSWVAPTLTIVRVFDGA